MNEQHIEIIPIHFNVPNHYLPLVEFIETANDVANILEDFNLKFFEGKLNIQILVMPSEDGSFLKKLGISVVLATTVSWGFIESDTGKGFVKGLTGHEPSYWAEKAGKKTKELLILKESTTGFLEKDNQTLNDFGIHENDFPSAFKARNSFYRMCLEDAEIAGIEFNDSGDFPISRANFANYFTPEVAVDDAPPKSVYKIHQLDIVAPVICEGSSAQWRTRDAKTLTPLNFHLKDDEFFQGILSGKYPLKETKKNDVITVCIEYIIMEENGEEKVCERNAIKVYKFNDVLIAKVPDDIDFEAVICQQTQEATKEDDRQVELPLSDS